MIVNSAVEPLHWSKFWCFSKKSSSNNGTCRFLNTWMSWKNVLLPIYFGKVTDFRACSDLPSEIVTFAGGTSSCYIEDLLLIRVWIGWLSIFVQKTLLSFLSLALLFTESISRMITLGAIIHAVFILVVVYSLAKWSFSPRLKQLCSDFVLWVVLVFGLEIGALLGVLKVDVKTYSTAILWKQSLL